ncbi:MAG: PilZ domain-containing protein [Acidobacteriota bacterium]
MKKRRAAQAGKVIQMPHTVERRSSRRFNVNWDAAVKGATREGATFDEQGSLANISSTGAYLSLTKPPALGAEMELWIRLPMAKDNWMKYPAQVVRVEGVPPRIGVAMRFHTARPSFFKP